MGERIYARFNAEASVADVFAFINDGERAGYRNPQLCVMDLNGEIRVTLERKAVG